MGRAIWVYALAKKNGINGWAHLLRCRQAVLEPVPQRTVIDRISEFYPRRLVVADSSAIAALTDIFGKTLICNCT
jgi:hypothetical protein